MEMKLILIVVLAGLMLCSCAKRDTAATLVPVPTVISESTAHNAPTTLLETIPVPYSQEAPLICSAESEEEALQIAEQYGIRLVEYSYGVASFYTEDDPSAVIRHGIDQGWTELSLNQIHPID